LDGELNGKDWLLGDRLSVLDLAWFISARRLAASGYPLRQHPHLNTWYTQLLKRESFREETAGSAAITHFLVPLYALIRRMKGTALGQVMKRIT
ncbi:MAG: glutathione S-transferase family protein, partial [Parvibaculaceae bacterium]|nr:glutathione S-transferase family protein [Parvibaculaceae bacterium]